MSDPTEYLGLDPDLRAGRPARPAARASAGHDRLPPHSPEAERGILGCLLLEPQEVAQDGRPAGEAMEECLRRGVDAGHFYDLRHQELFALARRLAADGKPFDLLLISDVLSTEGRLAAVGGLTYLNQLLGDVVSSANVGYYLDILLAKHALRQVIAVATTAIAEAYREPEDVVKLVAGVEASAIALSEGHVPTSFAPITEHMPAFIDMLELRHKGKQHITGIETPWWYLNNQTAGLQRHELTVIGARPSTGKTAMGLDIIRHAMVLGIPTLFFSLEMNPEQILVRLIAAEAKVDGLKLRNGFWSRGREESIRSATARVASWGDKLFLDHRSVLNGQDVWVGSRRAHRQHKVGLVVVDYLQLMQGTKGRYNTRNEEVGECSAWLKRVAKELPLAVVAMAQLNRESDRDKSGRAPTMADLRESGNVEQDADVIGLLWRPRIDDKDFDDMRWISHHQPDDPKEKSPWFMAGTAQIPGDAPGQSLEVNLGWKDEFQRVNLNVEKNRNGPTGPCELLFQKRSTRFVDLYSPTRVKEDQGEIL